MKSSAAAYVQVCVNIPGADVFDYHVPPALQPVVRPGMRVKVPFGRRRLSGVIVAVCQTSSLDAVRDILDVIDPAPLVNEELLALTGWMSRRYCCGWGEAMEAAIPLPFKQGRSPRLVRNVATPELSDSVSDSVPELTAHQQQACDRMGQELSRRTHGVFLLHGITASGKTEVYCRMIEQTIRQNRDTLVFVPEIAQTPQIVERLIGRFGSERVSLVHSRRNQSERYLAWQQISAGQTPVVIGARSAIFSPVPNLGLIIIDEEHETTYKQEDTPRYHLIPTAIERARLSQAVVILGSATPRLESMYQARRGYFQLVDLPVRVDGMKLPSVQVVDMRQQRGRGRHSSIISRPLEEALRQCLSRNEQAMLFLNRRGFATFIHCSKCGHVLQCPQCSVALVQHYERRRLECHQCGRYTDMTSVCPECRGAFVQYHGYGTEKVERELLRLFPRARVSRMDSDSLQRKNSHIDMYTAVRTRQIDILVGTQLLAKGFDIPTVSLVGVINADVAMNIPDFRTAERTFSLITQVAGRAGRGDLPGTVLVQTVTPEHYAIQCALRHDYAGFYAQEMEFRRQLRLPPYSRLIHCVVRGPDPAVVERSAQRLRECLNELCRDTDIAVMGPMALPRMKVRGQSRWAVLLKCSRIEQGTAVVRHLSQGCGISRSVKLSIDVDPVSLL